MSGIGTIYRQFKAGILRAKRRREIYDQLGLLVDARSYYRNRGLHFPDVMSDTERELLAELQELEGWS